MNKLRQRFMVVTVSVLLTVTHFGPKSAHAAMPVIDGANLKQNLISAVEAVAQTAQQIEQYKTQLQQYENQLQNTAAPTAYIWDQANQTMSELMSAYEDFYEASPCFSVDGRSTVTMSVRR